jgi:hypothetical protein
MNHDKSPVTWLSGFFCSFFFGPKGIPAMYRFAWSLMLLVALVGCMKSLEEQTKKSDKSIIGKQTQEIGEFDPKAKNKIVEPKVEVTNPVTGPLEAYGPIMQKISEIQIKPAIDLFHAENDRYPKDYEEFMQVIIKANNIKLPVLPGKKKYQYDVENHTLVVVENQDE